MFKHGDTFKDIINNVKIKEVVSSKKLFDKRQVFSMILLLDDNYNKEFANKFDVALKYSNDTYELEFLENQIQKFTYMQKSNFEKYFFRTVEKIIDNKMCKIEEFSILEENEKEYLRNLYSSSKKDYDENLTVVECFKKNVKERPKDICVIFEDQKYTYEYMDKKSDELAYYLTKRGIKKQQRVMIYMDRSEKIIISILAILKCQCVYVPIDISTPIERINVIYQDASPFCILVDDISKDIIKSNSFNTINILDIEEKNSVSLKEFASNYNSNKEDYCYIIYTSGTTGKPKGVAIRNRNIANFISNNIIIENLRNKKTATLVAVNKIGFDAFVGDILLPLGTGIKILMTSTEELNNPKKLLNSVRKYNGNIIQTTPTRISLSFLETDPKSLKNFQVIVSGGELLVDEIANKVTQNSNAVFINIYGPTETTVWATCAIVSKNEYGIGKPVQNANCFIFNKYMKFVPNGEQGIIYIAGAGLGSYCFDKEKNKQKYIKSKEAKEEIYDSGDIGYIDENNVLIFCERIDTQVKINGVRIELEEIESVALQLDYVMECVSIVKELPNLGKVLLLYYKSQKNKNYDNEIRKYLIRRLPATYIPRFFIKLDKMPVTLTHKIDRKKLPIPKENSETTQLVLPTNEIENCIYKAFLKCNNKNKIGVLTNITGLYDSLDIIKVYCELLELGYSFDIKTLTESDTIREMAIKYNNSNDVNKKEYPQTFFNEYDDINNYNNILLTGVTGFLGIHILQEILKSTKSNIICFVHNIKNLREIYEDYHMNIPYNQKRIKVIKGSLEKPNFGLNERDSEIINKADCIINCAAYVNYYGNKKIYMDSNIESVKNLIDFAINKNIVLNHISTLSVLGEEEIRDKICEKDLWFNQNIDSNQYVKSKFLAEIEIKKAAQKGLQYRVFRIGRLTWRVEDKKFQKNFDSNEFYNSLKLFIEMKQVPKNIMDTIIEISPIEYCAKAICKLTHQNRLNGVFHVYNDNFLTMREIIEYLNNYGCKIEVVNSREFMKNFTERKDEIKTRNMIHIYNNKYKMESNSSIDNNITKNILNSCNFKWPIITQDYFNIFK